MEFNYLGRDTLRIGLLLLRIVTICLFTYAVLMDITATYHFIYINFGYPYYPAIKLLGDTVASFGFALLFGIKRTLVTLALLMCLGVWDLKATNVPIDAEEVFTYLNPVGPLIFSLFLALAFNSVRNDHQRKQREIEMREHNRRLAIIKELHDGTAKRITQTLIHVRTNPPVDTEVVALLDDALSGLRDIIMQTNALYEHSEGKAMPKPVVELTTLDAFLDEHRVVMEDRNLSVDIRPNKDAFPPLPVCTGELIHNAVKYAKANSTIVITAGKGDKAHAIQVENQIPQDRISPGSQFGLETTRRAFNMIGASFTTFTDGHIFRATVILPDEMTEMDCPEARRQRLLNIFSPQLHT